MELEETGDSQPADAQWVHDMNALMQQVDPPARPSIQNPMAPPEEIISPPEPGPPVEESGEEQHEILEPPSSSPPENIPTQPPPVRRSGRQRNTPIKLSGQKFCGLAKGYKVTGDTMSRKTPKNYKQAAKEKPWMEPMKKEYQNLLDNNKFDLVSPESIASKRGRVVGEDCTLEDSTKVYYIRGLWTYRIKTKNGEIASYKA
jgi:hypothetical protein